MREIDGSFSTAYTSPSPTTSAFWSLREDIAELGVVLVFVDMVDADVSVLISIGDKLIDVLSEIVYNFNVPL
jgi:hypothetical protein